MNRKIGMAGALVTLAGVLGFALTMLGGSPYGSYVSSLFIALGFVCMICAFAAVSKHEARAASYASVAFGAVYAVLIFLVYFAQITTVRLESLTEQATRLLDYTGFGLMFNYDLLGYAFMAFSTFFAGLTVVREGRAAGWLKWLLMLHGLFAVCLIMPVLGMFRPGMAGGDLIGILILEFWCLYFTPLCILAFTYFRKRRETA